MRLWPVTNANHVAQDGARRLSKRAHTSSGDNPPVVGREAIETLTDGAEQVDNYVEDA